MIIPSKSFTSSCKSLVLAGVAFSFGTAVAIEGKQLTTTAKTLASGQPKPLGDNGLKPLSDIPPEIQAQLEGNEKLMFGYGLRATPAIAWRDAQGIVQMRVGVPAALQDILGGR